MMNVDHDNFGDIYMCVLMVSNKIIWFSRNMENHPRKLCNHNPYGSSIANLIRCVIVLVALSERNTGSSGLQVYSLVLLG
jgi:hypothetical protein